MTMRRKKYFLYEVYKVLSYCKNEHLSNTYLLYSEISPYGHHHLTIENVFSWEPGHYSMTTLE